MERRSINDTKFMFWNMGGNPIEKLIAFSSQELNLDFIMLAECEDANAVLLELNQNGSRFFIHAKHEAGRVDVFHRFPFESLQILGDHGGVSFLHLRHPIGNDILVVTVHMPSKLYRTNADQTLNCVRINAKIEEFEKKVGHKRTIVVGDFNINPYETGLVAADCLHATLSRNLAQRKTRVVDDKTCTFFYNPMWSHFGDRVQGPPGTYYYNASTATNIFWNIFDQVLIRPDLLDCFEDESVEILSAIGKTMLTKADGRPDSSIYSDHFPIVFALNLMEVSNALEEPLGRISDRTRSGEKS
jgi:hypothetical protein